MDWIVKISLGIGMLFSTIFGLSAASPQSQPSSNAISQTPQNYPTVVHTAERTQSQTQATGTPHVTQQSVQKNITNTVTSPPGQANNTNAATLVMTTVPVFGPLMQAHPSAKLILYISSGGVKNATNFYEDDGHVYCYDAIHNWQVIAGANPDTFQLIFNGPGSYINGHYGKDGKNVYSNLTCASIPGADPATFTFLINPNFAEDKTSVYYDDERIIGADPKTFTVLGEGTQRIYEEYATDAQNVYYASGTVVGADVATFSLTNALGNSFALSGQSEIGDAKDKNHFYFRGKIVDSK